MSDPFAGTKAAHPAPALVRPCVTDTIEGLFMDNENATYDAVAKNFLARKVFLARILKRCVSEFRDCPLDDIVGKYIEGEPEIGTTPVAPDLTNAQRKIHGENVEYTTLTEGMTTFDIRFVAYAPDTKELIKLIINIEAQKKHNPGYSLIKRGVFHGCRLMSSQYGVEFVEPDFDGIKKVVTIWICMTSPVQKESGITEYRLEENSIVGQIGRTKREYDLLQVVMVYIGSSPDTIEDELLRLLHLVFRARLRATEKTQKLHEDFGIVLDNRMKKEMNIMCNLSEGIAEEAREEGENKLGRLMSLLLRDGKAQEAQDAASDASKRKQLYLQYGIS